MRSTIRRPLLVALAVAALVLGGTVAWSAVTATSGSCTITSSPTVAPVAGGQQIKPVVICTVPNKTVTATATVTKTVTASSSPTPTPSPTPTSTPSPTSTATAGSWSCVVQLGGSCPGSGGYLDTAFSFNSNGYNTYVSNQALGGSGTQTISANSPSDWQVVSSLANQGGSVLAFPNAQQLYNDNSATSDGTYPISGLSKFNVLYDETSPTAGAAYEFAPDVFFGNYPNDVMFWTDTVGRCNAGAFGPSLLGHFTLNGQTWTAHRYDSAATTTTGNTGAEIILVLDGPGGPGTCAQQHSGSIDIKGGLQWLASQGFMPAVPSVYIVQTGWEITASSSSTFTVHALSYNAALN